MLKIESLKEALETGKIKKLPNYSYIGGYPLYYISSYGNIYIYIVVTVPCNI